MINTLLGKKQIVGISKLNLEPNQEAYLRTCLISNKTWFVIRKRSKGRCVQGSSETREAAEKTHRGWPGSTLIHIENGKVIWPSTTEKSTRGQWLKVRTNNDPVGLITVSAEERLEL